MSDDLLIHRLGFALRVHDHFSRMPVAEPLDVRVDTGEPSVSARGGTLRHADGTYRWANLSDGLRQVTVRSPSGRWVRWDPAPIALALPIAQPGTAVDVEMWPTPLAAVPAGVSAVRGKLVGAAIAGLRVEIDATGASSRGRFTFADGQGELLYLLSGGAWQFTPAGALDLTVTVPGRVVAQVEVRPGPVLFAGARFEVAPQRETRVRFHLS